MQNRTLPLSLLLGAALVMPGLAIAAPVSTGNIMPADMRNAPVDNTLQTEVEGPDGELLATQPDAIEVNEQDSLSIDAVAEQSLNKQHNNASYQPLIAGEAYSSSVTPADKRTTAAPVTLQEKKKDKRGELLATQPADIEFKENRRIVAR